MTLPRVLWRVIPALLALSAGCAEQRLIVDPNAPKGFESIEQAKITYELRLFGGDGQWQFNLKGVVHNTTAEPRFFNARIFCPVVLQVYSNSAATGEPVWDERVARGGCTNAPVTHTILPGDSLVLNSTQTTTNEILAHYGIAPPNPPGLYYFYASLATDLVLSREHRALVGFAQLR